MINMLWPTNVDGKTLYYVNHPSQSINYTVINQDIILGLNLGGALIDARVYKEAI